MAEEKNKHTLSFKELFRRMSFVASPRAIWLLLILFFLVVNLVQVLLLGQFFYSVTYSEPNPNAVTAPSVESLSREHMTRTLEDFSRRVGEFEALKTSYQAPSDPSR